MISRLCQSQPRVRRELRSIIALVRDAAYTEPVGRRLLGAAGELAQLAGWVASDAGWYVAAERSYLGGVYAAGDDPLAANLLSSLSYQLANVGDRKETVLLATALRALGEVDEAYANRSPEADPIWVCWLNRDEIDVMAGRCLTELRRAERAIGLLGKAVEAYDDSHARELALYLSWLAEAQVLAGQIDEAAAVATRAVYLSSTVTSARGTDRIRLLRGILAPFRGTATVDEFDEQAAITLDSAADQSG